MALTPSGAIEEWRASPWNVARTPCLPLCPMMTFISVGSPMKAPSGLIRFFATSRSIGRTPTQPISSS